MDMENKKLELKIPEKVSDHQYVIQGIGKHEMTILVIQFLVAIGLLLICAIFGNITIGLFIGAAIVIITFFLLIRDNANENLIDKVRIMMNYSKMQKKYYYEYFNVYDPKKENTMETETLGSATSPNGQVIESTSVYSRISYQVDGYFGVTVPAEKDKLVDIVKNN